jgi:hypothetical protein
MPAYEDVLQGELLESGSWIVAELQTSLAWPTTQQKVTYLDRDYWLIPTSRESFPAVTTKRHHQNLREDQTELLRFLSALSWAEDKGVLLEDFSGGNLPRVMRRQRAMLGIITGYLDLPYLPIPTNDDGRMALALMREGRGLQHSAYAFLSLWRALEVAIEAKDRGAWLTEALAALGDHHAEEALQRLLGRGITDVAAHLKDQRRHAIAHGRRSPRVDPDDASISEQLREELPIIERLAEMAIEQKLGIHTSHTVYREHLYELAGFKERIGPDVLADIFADPEAEGKTVDLPIINFRLKRRDPFVPFEAMQPVGVFAKGKLLHLGYESADGLVRLSLTLDFENERLEFDWNAGLQVHDDGSPSAATNAAEVSRFLFAYLGNGQLHIYDAESGRLLSRKDAFIPTNFFVNHEGFTAQIERWEAEAETRKAAVAEPDGDPAE